MSDVSGVFVDGSVNHDGCNCGDECSLPCWQRVGVAPACERCGCAPFAGDTPRPQRDAATDARALVYGDRQKDYGPPERNLQKIGVVWGALLDKEPLSPRLVAVMLAAMKTVRASGRDNRDDLIDGIGYLLLADESSDD
jgi:hypothetical protein